MINYDHFNKYAGALSGEPQADQSDIPPKILPVQGALPQPSSFPSSLPQTPLDNFAHPYGI